MPCLIFFFPFDGVRSIVAFFDKSWWLVEPFSLSLSLFSLQNTMMGDVAYQFRTIILVS